VKIAATPNGWAGRVLILVTSALALIVLVSPLLMWVSWTEKMFVGVIVLGVIAGGLYCLLDRFADPVAGDPGRAPRTLSALDDQMVAELSNLGPMIYHNRLSAEGRLRKVLDRVKRSLREADGS
jgi:hypothetical protein